MIDNDDDLYDHVRTEFGPVRLRDTLDNVTARGQELRRRRYAVTALGVVLIAAATTFGLALGHAADTTPDRPSPLQPAAWSVEAEPDGTVVLTIRQLTDADQLSATLKENGVPARVEFKQLGPGQVAGCVENGQPASPLLYDVMPMPLGLSNGNERVFTIRRDLMPPGASLHFVIFDKRGDNGVRQSSVRTSLVNGDPVPCETYGN